MGPAPALVGGDKVILGEDQDDLVLEVGKGGEEVIDRLALAGAAAGLSVVDEVGAQQALAGARVAFDDRLAVEAADQLPVLLEPDAPTVSPSTRYGQAIGCFVVLFALISPRLALFALWLFSDLLSRAFDSWFVPFLGFFLLPWTTLAYAAMWASSDRVYGFEWFIVILAFVIDLGSYARSSRERASRA
ncbi:MAG TPA: hypothetical protein VG518_10305 [Solirubrobacterales bacterium]|nr:hypothetical protein [Solirubrobacterales bacterium]